MQSFETEMKFHFLQIAFLLPLWLQGERVYVIFAELLTGLLIFRAFLLAFVDRNLLDNEA